MKFIIILLLLLCPAVCINISATERRDTIDLQGVWKYRLKEPSQNASTEGELILPGSLDSNGIGDSPSEKVNTSKLTRRHSYEGIVNYTRTFEIPEDDEGKPLTLKIERTRPSTLLIDGEYQGSCSYLSAPHIYELPEGLSAGVHKIDIIIDNKDAIPLSVRKNSNQASEYTQTNWNGMTGEIIIIIKELEDLGNNLSIERKDETMPRLEVRDGRFEADGHPVFLRGVVDNCVFPLTGYPPTDEKTWREYFRLLDSYGFNHVRFHSWCPPEAAFKAADDAGFYLQIELPVWGEIDKDLISKNEFLKNELVGILDAYSHHPSFALFAVGNELWGDVEEMQKFTDRVKEKNPGILTTLSSDLYSGMYGIAEGDDFVVASRLGRADDRSTDLRGSYSFADVEGGGIVNTEFPAADRDISERVKGVGLPVITHELGQFQTYPYFEDIGKYTGVLSADNLVEFRARAVEAGTLKKAGLYAEASADWVLQLYKMEIERQLRSQGIGGFQLMAFQDYPGQGTANVGLTNSLIEPKKGMDVKELRKSNGPVVILAELPGFTYEDSESISVPVKIANYSAEEMPLKYIRYELGNEKGTLAVGKGEGLIEAGTIKLELPTLTSPEKLTLKLRGVLNEGYEERNGEKTIENTYDIWVYPREIVNVKGSDKIMLTTSLDEALEMLEKGKKVILAPDTDLISRVSLEPLFATDFWNYRMYRTLCDHLEKKPSPGTLGLLIDSASNAFELFPTERHTDRQWYEIVMNSRPLIIDRLPAEVDPLIEVIDNVERNYRLALMLECRSGDGELIILPMNISQLEKTPEGRWFLTSVKNYMLSKSFKPTLMLTSQQIVNLLTVPSNPRLIKELKNETYDNHCD